MENYQFIILTGLLVGILLANFIHKNTIMKTLMISIKIIDKQAVKREFESVKELVEILKETEEKNK